MARPLPRTDLDLSPLVTRTADLGRLVRNARAMSGVRIDDAAHLAGVSSDLVSRLENGRAVTTDKLLALLDTLGLSMVVMPRAQAVRVVARLAAPEQETGDAAP